MSSESLTKSLCRKFIGCIFLGVYTSEAISINEILGGFRSLSVKELRKRRNESKYMIELMTLCRSEWFYSDKYFEPFDKGIKIIESQFDVDDYVKLFDISSDNYSSERFKIILDHDRELARKIYIKYLRKAINPKDKEIYLPMFQLSLNRTHIYHALGNYNEHDFKELLRYTSIKSIDISNDNVLYGQSKANVKLMHDAGILINSQGWRVSQLLETF